MDEPVVLYETRGHVATITMNRPEVANAQDTALIDGIDACLDRADADDEVRVVVLAGNGSIFRPATTSRRSWATPRPTSGVACEPRPRASSATNRSCTWSAAS